MAFYIILFLNLLREGPMKNKVGKTLYHGTTLDQIDGIKRFGLVPGGLDGSAGRFTSEMWELEGLS